MLKEEKLLLALVSNALFAQNLTIEYDSMQLKNALTEARKQTVFEIACYGIPGDNKLVNGNDYLLKTAANNLRIEYGHVRIHEILTRAGIDYVILKGCTSSNYYPNPELRVMGDVDFLVKPEDVEKTRAVLLEKGFQEETAENDHHISFRAGGVCYELHHEVPGIPYGAAGQKAKAMFSDIWQKRRLLSCSSGEYYAPSEFHHGLILVLHNCHHWITGGIGLRHLCDWAVYCNQADNLRAVFCEPLKAMGLWEFTKQMTDLCVVYLRCPVENWRVGTAQKQMDAMIEDVFYSGNFGHKNANGNYEAKFFSDNGKSEVGKKSLLRQLGSSISVAVRRDWPKASKIAPARWILCMYFSLRESVKMLLGKRAPVHAGSLIRNTKTRKALYENFRLFVPEWNETDSGTDK